MSDTPGDHARRPGALSTLFTGKAEDVLSDRPSATDPDLPAEKERQIMLGQAAETVAGLQDRYHVAGKNHQETLAREKKRKQRHSDLIITLDALRRDLDRLEAAVAVFEKRFEDRFGDAWREQIALEILGADAIPRQRDGESIREYRERLEAHLIAEMLDPDGSIKDEYRDNPNTRDSAQWAKTRFNENRARSLVQELEDPTTSPERRGQLLDELESRSNLEEMTFADRSAATSVAQVRDAAEKTADNQTSLKLSDNEGQKFLI